MNLDITLDTIEAKTILALVKDHNERLCIARGDSPEDKWTPNHVARKALRIGLSQMQGEALTRPPV